MMDKLPIIYHDSYSQLVLPSKHRFPIGKYQATKDLLISQLEKLCLYESVPISVEQLTTYHDSRYVAAFVAQQIDTKSMRRIGLPQSPELVTRTLHAVGGTLTTCEAALKHKVACHLSGGYHHAFYQHGSGFCIFNDLYIAASEMLKHRDIEKVLIFDLDVHQGDGTAKLAESNPNIYTCSLHCEKNFPARKQSSTFDFNLEKGLGDCEYLQTVEEALELAIRLSQPDLVIYDAGVDVHIDDALGYLNISTAGIYQRDELVLRYCKEQNIPIATVMGGGYQDDVSQLAWLHSQLINAAYRIYVEDDKTNVR